MPPDASLLHPKPSNSCLPPPSSLKSNNLSSESPASAQDLNEPAYPAYLLRPPWPSFLSIGLKLWFYISLLLDLLTVYVFPLEMKVQESRDPAHLALCDVTGV